MSHIQPSTPEGPAPHAILSSIPSDSHTWNLLFMQLLLSEQNWSVTNLGPCVPVEVLRDEAVARQPRLIVISTVNGHGCQDGVRLARTLRAVPALATVPMVLGGKLDVDGSKAATMTGELRDAGFDEVFVGGSAVTDFLGYLRRMAPATATERT
ncbi:methylaspartate mutase sigma subunit [Stackebrandtia albiflava]|uniref:Methylaspartate mutase sigma subunit n=1 Tax=Stackebrandtia albiflava TaxID=406432 RepID=A0A562VC22_9ACTN|nr:cobalamin-dependent protein [Stackebrandtia albiflava]TWJ15361.1 methylaspartate mutase sigma subunit [Stackebrandtia albiflava]